MSDFFDKLKKNIDKGVSKASKKSAEIAEKTKLKTQIISLKNDKKSEINELGELTYSMFKEGNLDEEMLNTKFEKIMEIEKEIEAKEEERENVEEEKEVEEYEEVEESEQSEQITCPNCGEKNPPEAKFCQNCGTNLS